MLPDLDEKKKKCLFCCTIQNTTRVFMAHAQRCCTEIRLRFSETPYNHESKFFAIIVLHNRNGIMCRPPVK